MIVRSSTCFKIANIFFKPLKSSQIIKWRGKQLFSEVLNQRKAPFNKMSISKLNVNFSFYPTLSQEEEALPKVARAIKYLSKSIEKFDKKQKSEFLNAHEGCEAYLKNLALSLEKSSELELYKYPNDLMNILISLHKIDNSLVSQAGYNSIVKNQLMKVTNINSQYIVKCASFFSKIGLKDKEFWEKIKQNLTPVILNEMSESEMINLMWGLYHVDQLDDKLYIILNNIILEEKYQEMNFTDLGMLSNLYKRTKDKKALSRLSVIFTKIHQKLASDKVLPRSISNIFWSFSSVYKLVHKDTWTLLVKNFLSTQIRSFENPQDIAQILVSTNKIYNKKDLLDNTAKQTLKEACIILCNTYLTNLQTRNSSRRSAVIDEHDLCNILFSAINLKFIPERNIEFLTQIFVQNLKIIKPLGIGYTLHALSLKQKKIFNRYQDQILTFLRDYKDITKENIGYILWVLQDVPQSESQLIINKITESMISNKIPILFSSQNIGQYFYTFHCFQTFGVLKEKPELFNKMIEIFLQTKTLHLEEPMIFEYSMFFLSLMLHYNYKLPNDQLKIQALRTKLEEVSLIILERLKPSYQDLKGFGTFTLCMSKSGINNQKIWTQIRKLALDLNFTELELLDSLYLIKGLENYGGHKEVIDELKYKLFDQKINSTPIEELIVTLNKENVAKQAQKLYSSDLKWLLDKYKADSKTDYQLGLVNKLEKVLYDTNA